MNTTPNSETSVKELAKELLNLYGCSPVGARFSATLISKEVEEYLQHLLWYAPGITRAYLALLKEHQIQAEALATLAKGSNRLMEEMKYLVNKNERLEKLIQSINNFYNQGMGDFDIEAALATTEPTLNTDENGERL